MLEEMIKLFLCEHYSFDEYGAAGIDNIENLGAAINVRVQTKWVAIPEIITIDTLDLMVWLYGRTRNANPVD